MTRYRLNLDLEEVVPSQGRLMDAVTLPTPPALVADAMTAEPMVIAATLRAIADQIDPPKRVTR